VCPATGVKLFATLRPQAVQIGQLARYHTTARLETAPSRDLRLPFAESSIRVCRSLSRPEGDPAPGTCRLGCRHLMVAGAVAATFRQRARYRIPDQGHGLDLQGDRCLRPAVQETTECAPARADGGAVGAASHSEGSGDTDAVTTLEEALAGASAADKGYEES